MNLDKKFPSKIAIFPLSNAIFFPRTVLPLNIFEERYIQLEAVRYIDEIRIYSSESELYDLLCEIEPDVRILGTDYDIPDKRFTGDDLNIPIYFHKRDHDYSSTSLRKKIKKA